MIRLLQPKDLNAVMDLWLTSNLEAHPFVVPAYWEQNFNMIKELLPQAEVWVYERDFHILGFMGITDGYIAGIFVDSSARSKGIGKELLDWAKQQHDRLTLHVYEKNQRAVNFYLREGFLIQTAQFDESTKETEFTMIWNL